VIAAMMLAGVWDMIVDHAALERDAQ